MYQKQSHLATYIIQKLEYNIIYEVNYHGARPRGFLSYLMVKYDSDFKNVHSYWKVPGWYNSYHGGKLEWENIHRVKPVEKMVIDWEAF
jgi:hypothetical protein